MSVQRTNFFENRVENSGGFVVTGVYSWDYGFNNNLPVWIDFITQDTVYKGAFYTHSMPYSFAFEMVLEGALNLTIGENSIDVYSGEVLVIPAGVDNVLKCNVEHCKKRSFGFCGCCAEVFLNAMHIPIGEKFLLQDLEKLSTLLDEFTLVFRNKNESDILEVYAYINKILLEIKNQSCGTSNNIILSKAVRLLNGIFCTNLSMENITKELNISYDVLYDTFKKELGISPKKYIINLRMNKAKSLLMNSNITIKEIAFACGYQSPIQFNNQFKGLFNLTPKAFRQNTQISQ